MKVSFLTVMPSPYVQDLFTAMAADKRFELRVLYLEQVAPDTYWGEQNLPEYAEVLPGRWVGISGARVHLNPTVKRRLDELDSDIVVVVGYIGLTNQIAMRHLTRRAKRWVFWGEVPGFQKRGFVGRKIRGFLQRPLKHAAGIAAVGTGAFEAYRVLKTNLGGRPIPIHNIPYHCSLVEFVKTKRAAYVGPIRFLYCGQLIERKGVDLLLKAFQRLVENGHEAKLVLAGEGPMRTTWERSLPKLILEHVSFLGFQHIDKLPRIFSEADVFLLPSRHDGWGVVVNQAIGAGLPVIASENVGAAHDLVEHGKNGLRVAANCPQSIFEAMERFATDKSLTRSASEASQKLAEQISLPAAMDDWHAFFEATLESQV